MMRCCTQSGTLIKTWGILDGRSCCAGVTMLRVMAGTITFSRPRGGNELSALLLVGPHPCL